MIIKKQPQAYILKQILIEDPKILDVLVEVRRHVPRCKREVELYQASVICYLASKYNWDGARLLEIGTAFGYSAAMIAMAVPKGQVITLTPKEHEVKRATEYLSFLPNVEVIQEKSWDYLANYSGPQLDFIFIDGDHGKVVLDFGWWKRLRVGGLMLFHDYAPKNSYRPCQPVFKAVEALRKGLGRPFDVLVIDTSGVGLAGFYRKENESLPDLNIADFLWEHAPQNGWYKLDGRCYAAMRGQ